MCVDEMICNKCKKLKKMTDFYKDRRQPDGRSTICKECRLEDQRARRIGAAHIFKRNSWYRRVANKKGFKVDTVGGRVVLKPM